ncbi:MAG: hypothetical protein AAFX05_04640, partial [Planctomycetota bacterium]
RIVALFDPNTGAIDSKVAEAWRSFDIAHLVREQPERAALLRERAHIFAAADDQFGLAMGAALLFEALREGEHQLDPAQFAVVPGTDHASIEVSQPVRRIPIVMEQWLRDADGR